jgi:hypothetical protein
MRIVILFAFLMCSFCLVSKEPSAFRVVLACDTFSQDISSGTNADFSRMKKTMYRIGSRIGMKPQFTLLKGSDLSLTNIKSWVASLPKPSNDILIFYFSGHGFRYANTTSKWPFLYLHGQSVSGQSIYQEIRKIQPRFALVLFDCCNNKIAYRKSPSQHYHSSDFVISGRSSIRGIRSLFLRSRGIVTVSASSPGEYAIALVGQKPRGSVFTMGLLNSLRKNSRKTNANWKSVLKNTVFFCNQQLYEKQHPVYSIEKK